MLKWSNAKYLPFLVIIDLFGTHFQAKCQNITIKSDKAQVVRHANYALDEKARMPFAQRCVRIQYPSHRRGFLPDGEGAVRPVI